MSGGGGGMGKSAGVVREERKRSAPVPPVIASKIWARSADSNEDGSNGKSILRKKNECEVKGCGL